MHNFFFWMTVGFLVAVIFASFFECALHRYFMHRPVGKFDYPFRAHAVIHHQTFKADHTYHLIDEKDKKTIPMAWWNGPVLVLVGMIPFAIVSMTIGAWGLTVGAMLACASYYGAYEYIHWC